MDAKTEALWATSFLSSSQQHAIRLDMRVDEPVSWQFIDGIVEDAAIFAFGSGVDAQAHTAAMAIACAMSERPAMRRSVSERTVM